MIAILSDGLVVVLTWMKTYRVHVLTRGVDFRTNYSTLILRDGTVYFLSVPVPPSSRRTCDTEAF